MLFVFIPVLSHAVVQTHTIDMSQFDRSKGRWAVRSILIESKGSNVTVQFTETGIRLDDPVVFNLPILLSISNIQSKITEEIQIATAERLARAAQYKLEKDTLFLKHGFDEQDIKVLNRLILRMGR